jgi:hypothetical protein
MVRWRAFQRGVRRVSVVGWVSWADPARCFPACGMTWCLVSGGGLVAGFVAGVRCAAPSVGKEVDLVSSVGEAVAGLGVGLVGGWSCWWIWDVGQ